MNVNFPIPRPEVAGSLDVGPPALTPQQMHFLRGWASRVPNHTFSRLTACACDEIVWLRRQLQRAYERAVMVENAIALERKLTQDTVADDDPLSRC